MKRSIILVSTFVLWPAVAFGGIEPIEPYSFANFPNFCMNETLLLSGQTSLMFRANLIASRSIRCINVKDSQLDIYVESFDGFPNLMYLDLSGNRIERSNLYFSGNASNIRGLKFSDLRSVNAYYEGKNISIVVADEYPQLMYLDISDILLQEIRIFANNPFPKLTHLYMSRIESSTSIASILSYVKYTLKHLDLSNSEQSDVRLSGMDSLETLTLDGNDFYNIGEYGDNALELKGLSNLVSLSIANNKIHRISETAFKDTVHLRQLDLSMNHLDVLNGETFSNLTLLKVLVLDGNLLDTVSFDRFLNLTKLSLNCNRIKELPANSFHYLPRLEELSLNGNNISKLYEHTFRDLVQLSELRLRDNQLSHIPTSIWKDLKKLKYLDVSGNMLTSLSYIVGCPANRIQFDGNSLEYINATELTPNTLIFLNSGVEYKTKPCSTKLNQLDDDTALNMQRRF